jgi:hypothetical protein
VIANEQLKLFLSCLAIGFLGGACHDLFAGVVTPMKKEKWEGRAYLVYEIAYFLSFALAFVGLQARMGFPDPRMYLYFGIFIGFWLYYKNLQIILAFFKKVCYNIVTKMFCKRKNSQKRGE